MKERLNEVLNQRMIPQPESVSFRDGACVIADGVRVEAGTDEFAEIVKKRFRQFWNVVPAVAVTPGGAAEFADGEYRIDVSPERIALASRTAAGLEYALGTLRQLAEPERGTAVTRNHVLQACEIHDAPVLAFRGIHLCIFPETPMWFVEKQVRLAAYHKFNYAVIEAWGVFPFRSHPEFGWADRKKSREEFERLREAAVECGITLIPQFNLFGHASMSRVGSAKHAVLDAHPELAPLFEPAGWSFCLSNPETRKVLAELAAELHEFYGNPPYFHIGCDEAYDFQTCRECAGREPVELLNDHIAFFRDLFAERGARVIMWHDMLLETGDPRWKECIVGGNARTVGLLDVLPKDVLIADWQYGVAPEADPDGGWPTSPFFQGRGFEVMICPWMDRRGIRQAGAMAEKRKLFGLLETTWHTNSGHDFEPMFIDAALAAWSGGRSPDFSLQLALAAHLRDVGRDMGLRAYEESGHTESQIASPSFQR